MIHVTYTIFGEHATKNAKRNQLVRGIAMTVFHYPTKHAMVVGMELLIVMSKCQPVCYFRGVFCASRCLFCSFSGRFSYCLTAHPVTILTLDSVELSMLGRFLSIKLGQYILMVFLLHPSLEVRFRCFSDIARQIGMRWPSRNPT